MSNAELKARAREQLKGKALNAAAMLFVYGLVIWVVSSIVERIFPGETKIIMGYAFKQSSAIASIIEGFLTVLLSLGMTSYYMKLARGEEVTIAEIFSKTSLWLKAFVTSFLVGLAVATGFILLIVPGIILTFAYSMVYYLYIDNPEIGITEVMKKSREMMRGHKWDFFCLGFSFIGWMILGVFTFGILYFWLMPYMAVSQVYFYDSIKENGSTVIEQ